MINYNQIEEEINLALESYKMDEKVENISFTNVFLKDLKRPSGGQEDVMKRVYEMA